MTRVTWHGNVPIRYKLLLGYSAVFFLTFAVSSAVVYSLVRRTVEANIESALKNSTEVIFNLVRTSAAVAIKNHLRVLAEKNRDIVEHYHAQQQQGLLSVEEAKRRATEVLLAQRIGAGGYMYCIDSLGVVRVHPVKDLRGFDVSSYDFVQEQIARKEGYLEYHWRNPGEDEPRAKAVYMTYFEPWDWIVSASAYRDEFKDLVAVNDFRQGVLSLRFAESGYAYVIDRQGKGIIHPERQGENLLAWEGLPADLLARMLREKSGTASYDWHPPTGALPRQKLVTYNYLPEYEWLVVSASYLDEVYAPLRRVRDIVLATLAGSLLLVLPLTFQIASSITNPLGELMRRLASGAGGDLTGRVAGGTGDEVGRLTSYFNAFMGRLEAYNASLEGEVRERRQAESLLRESEERYRSVMEAAPDPTVAYDTLGRVTYLNPAFREVFGWTLEECRGRKLDHFVPDDCWPETRNGIQRILGGERLSGIESRRYTRAGEAIHVSISGAPYRGSDGELAGTVITLRDVTQARRLEREVLETGDRERQRIGEEIHDDLGPHLIGVEVLSKVLTKRLAEKGLPEADAADQIRVLTAEAIQKARGLVRGLCPVHVTDNGLEFALKDLARTTEVIFGVPCSFRSDGEPGVADNAVAAQLFYIAREAVHNAVKHAAASGIAVELSRRGAEVRLAVRDDGRGLPPAPGGGGLGTRIMGFRAKMIGASLELTSAPGEGTSVVVAVDAGEPAAAG